MCVCEDEKNRAGKPELQLPLFDLLHLAGLQVTQVIILITHLHTRKVKRPQVQGKYLKEIAKSKKLVPYSITLTGSTLNVARPRDASLPAKLEYGLRGRAHAYCIYIACILQNCILQIYGMNIANCISQNYISIITHPPGP